jgi:hypothetical protein
MAWWSHLPAIFAHYKPATRWLQWQLHKHAIVPVRSPCVDLRWLFILTASKILNSQITEEAGVSMEVDAQM